MYQFWNHLIILENLPVAHRGMNWSVKLAPFVSTRVCFVNQDLFELRIDIESNNYPKNWNQIESWVYVRFTSLQSKPKFFSRFSWNCVNISMVRCWNIRTLCLLLQFKVVEWAQRSLCPAVIFFFMLKVLNSDILVAPDDTSWVIPEHLQEKREHECDGIPLQYS